MKTTPIDSLRGGVDLDPAGAPTSFRVGILTFHSQLNYGGVLQAWALQEALRGLGCDVRVIDRWQSPTAVFLWGLLARRTPMAFVRLALCMALGCGRVADTLRRARTARFIRDRLALTPYHFYRWEELEGRDLGLDCVVVGSDQVWTTAAENNEPDVYLLQGAPGHPKAISYAASFSTPDVAERWRRTFLEGLARFSAISVREAQGVAIAERLGFRAEHVLDPTQLIPATVWRERLSVRPRPAGAKPMLVCYFMQGFASEALLPRLRALRRFAKRMGCEVHLLLDCSYTDLPHGPKALLAHLRRLGRYLAAARGIHVHRAAGPREFVGLFANATWVLSESFHAMMFASLFGKEMRVLTPPDDGSVRRRAFSRFESFAGKYVRGPLFAGNVGEALESFARGERVTFDEAALEADRTRSRAWLRAALDRVRGEPATQG